MAGCAAAWHLADADIPVDLFEAKPGAHHKVCGEFLSAEGYELLRAILGSDLDAVQAPKMTKALFSVGRQSLAFDLPQTCYGLTRYWIDEAMLGAVAAKGVTLHRDQYLNTLPSGRVVLATGKREHPQTKRFLSGGERVMVGLKQHLGLRSKLPSDLQGLIHLFFYPGGYGGLMEVEGGRVSLALAVTKQSLTELGTTASAHMHQAAKSDPSLQAWFDVCDLDTETLAIGRVPYGFQHKPNPNDNSAVYRIGDQAAVIPSYSGDGMSIALASGLWVAEALKAGESALGFHKRLAAKTNRNVRFAHMIGPIVARPSLAAPLLASARIMGLSGVLGSFFFHRTRTSL